MRWRLFLAFTLIILITAASMAYTLRQNALVTVQNFARRGGFQGTDTIISQLEVFYAMHGSWQGVDDSLLTTPPAPFGAGQMGGPGQGQMGGPGWGQGSSSDETQGNQLGFGGGRMNMSLLDAEGNWLAGAALTTAVSLDQIQAYGFPIEHHGQVVGYLLSPNSRVITSEGIENSLGGPLTKAALNTGLLAGALALVLAITLGYFLLKPVRQLTNAAANLASGDLSQRVTITGSDELVTLGETFNNMAASLQQAETRRRTLTADIAHELRTPLAVQRANLEAIQDGVYDLSLENMTAILEQNQLLTRLVEDLRLLALSDENELHLLRENVDLAELLGQISERFQAQAEKNEITLTYNRPATSPTILADPARLEQIFNNLLQNALQHTPSSGQVTLAMTSAAGHVTITVHDSGPGIPPEALPHIFDRLYRADQARARDQGGSGLGLTIARRLVQAHGGTLQGNNHPQGGAIFTLTLPLERGN